MWLWACHGPNGQAITAAPFTATDAPELGGGCAAPDAAGSPAGYQLKLAAAPADGSKSSLVVALPSGLSAKAVKINRALRGFEGSTGVSYRVSANNQTLETNAAPGTGALPIATPAQSVTLDLSCSSACASSAAVDVVSVAFLVEDNSAPDGGLGWNTPVDKEMIVKASATDAGAGLDRAVLTIAGMPGATRSVAFNEDKCKDLSPADATNDRPLDQTACINGTKAAGHTDANPKPLDPVTVSLKVWQDDLSTGAEDPLRLPEGLFTRTVTVYDVAGNAREFTNNTEVWHPPAPVAVRTLNISTASVTEQGSGNNNGTPPGGGVQGSQASQCRSPRLSVVLSSKPVRVSKNVPVLRYKKAYRFKGRLTCVINGKRQSAPKRTKVSLLNKVGKKTVRKPNTAIRAKGAVDLKLAFVSDRTVIFRYTNAAGQKSEVKIKVRVTKKKK